MVYAVMLGSNMFIGNHDVLNVEITGKPTVFFRIREIFRARSEGSFLTVDCDIKDSDNKREIKLFKNKPVAHNDDVIIESNSHSVIARRPNGTTIIKVEQINADHVSLPKSGPIPEHLTKHPVDAILRITGDFYAGQFHVLMNNESMKIGSLSLSSNISINGGGIVLGQMGFSM